MRLVQLAVVAGVLAAAVAFAGVGRPESAHGSAQDTRSVTVTGTASVQAVPDKAAFSAGVSTNAATAQAALAANAAKAAHVLDALRSAGVAKGDLQTQDVSVSPRWNDRGEQEGFTAHSSVQVHVQNARRDAFAEARLKAATLAGEAGASLGRVLRIAESSATPGPVPYEMRAMADTATPVEPGKQEVQASVTVTFSLS